MKKGLDYIADDKTEILILGTAPGNDSLEKEQYYQNKNNQFWKIMSYILDEELTDKDYKEKIEILKQYKIGLWDVFAAFEGKNCEDTRRKFLKLNDFETFFRNFQNIGLIILNGYSKNYEKFKEKFNSKNIVNLPSTSGANTNYSLEEKKKIWKRGIIE